MDDERKDTGKSDWREGWVLEPEIKGEDEVRSFRTLETPGVLAPFVVPVPWSFDPGLPAGAKMTTSSLSRDAFVLGFTAADGAPSLLRCRVTASGQLTGEASGAASPSLFAPGREPERKGRAWTLELPDHRAALVVEPRGQGVRFGLAWGDESEEALTAAAEALLESSLPDPPREEQEGPATEAGPEAGQQAPSVMAEWMNRHGGKALAGALALIAVMVVWGVADAPGTGTTDDRELARLVRQLNYVKRYDDALAVCEQAEKQLQKGMADLLRGLTYYRQGNYEQAAASYRRALEAEGSVPKVAMLNLASSLYRAGKPTEAAAMYQDFIDKHGEARPVMARKATLALEILAEVEGTLPPKNVGH